MADRLVIEAHWGYIDLVLKSGVTAEKGKIACWDRADGSLTKGAIAATLIPIGLFHTGLVGDGVKKVTVKLFTEITGYWWNNAAVGTTVAAANVGSICYLEDDQTVSMTTTGASKAGMVLAVDSKKGVLVYSGYPFNN